MINALIASPLAPGLVERILRLDPVRTSHIAETYSGNRAIRAITSRRSSEASNRLRRGRGC